MEISSLNKLSMDVFCPTEIFTHIFWYSSGAPKLYMLDTEATTITSFRSSIDVVAFNLNLSMWSFTDESFSM